jgi:hypothetical protein
MGSITTTNNTSITTSTTTKRSAEFTAFFLPDAPVEADIAPH